MFALKTIVIANIQAGAYFTTLAQRGQFSRFFQKSVSTKKYEITTTQIGANIF